MARVPLENVRYLTLREIAEMWAPEAQIPVSLMLRELRIAVINIARRRAGEASLIETIPPDSDLPDPDERVDRQWLVEFCTKQGWRSPRFWATRPNRDTPASVGRPPYPHWAAVERELRRRAADRQLSERGIGEMRYLRDWAREQFPNDEPPVLGRLENRFRELYRELKESQ